MSNTTYVWECGCGFPPPQFHVGNLNGGGGGGAIVTLLWSWEMRGIRQHLFSHCWTAPKEEKNNFMLIQLFFTNGSKTKFRHVTQKYLGKKRVNFISSQSTIYSTFSPKNKKQLFFHVKFLAFKASSSSSSLYSIWEGGVGGRGRKCLPFSSSSSSSSSLFSPCCFCERREEGGSLPFSYGRGANREDGLQSEQGCQMTQCSFSTENNVFFFDTTLCKFDCMRLIWHRLFSSVFWKFCFSKQQLIIIFYFFLTAGAISSFTFLETSLANTYLCLKLKKK